MIKKIWNKTKSFFKWLWSELKDWKTLVLFLLVVVVMSSEIWVPYLLAFIFGFGTSTGKWLLGIASTCWLFWLGPFTPFIPLCVGITFGIKGINEKLKARRKARVDKRVQKVQSKKESEL